MTVLMLGGGAALACVPQPRLVTVQPRSSGPSGSEVTIAALGFDPGRVEVRWNAADGELLGSPNGPDFSVKVAIPEAPSGLYHLIVLARSPGGEIGNTAAVAFQVTPPGGVPSVRSSPPTSRALGEAGRSGDAGTAPGVLVAGGVGLAGLGCLVGVALARRRPGAPAPADPTPRGR